MLLFFCFYNYYKNRNTLEGKKVVLCIPVYGQSLALGEEAIRITDFDSLRIKYDGRIVTENLDYSFGYLDDELSRQHFKKLIHYDKRAYELSSYRMAQELVSKLGSDTIICIFPGGTGMSQITIMNKSTQTYNKFLYELEHAYKKAKDKGWSFYVPAICWMQGESDIIDYPRHDYKKLLKQFSEDINNDIKTITKQKEDIRIITYQSNVVTRAEKFENNNYICPETKVPQAIVDLVTHDSLFWASGPTYPYEFVNERLHIDAIGQQHIGYLDAMAVINILRKGRKSYGVTPLSLSIEGKDIIIKFNVPSPPLVFDTISVSPINHYGFSVISKDNIDILTSAFIERDNTVRLTCLQNPIGCKVRYAINGKYMKSGFKNGPRGNLRDSQGETYIMNVLGGIYPINNWAYQFDMPCN